MDLLQLRSFLAVADTRSFTDGAARMHVSQPALSYQVRKLEDELGTRLFDRTSRRVSLSADGRFFLPLAQEVLSRADEALAMMAERQGIASGEVALGSIPSVGTYIVPHVLASFRRDFPGVTVKLYEAGTHELERSVLEGEADVAIVSVPAAPGNLEVTPLVAEELVLVTSIHHRLARRRSINVRELADEDFVVPEQSFALADQLQAAARRAGFEPRVAYVTGSLESVRSFAAHDLGVAVLPRLALQGPEDPFMVAIPFDDAVTRDLNLIRAKDRYATVATQALMAHVQTVFLSSPFSGVVKPLPPPRGSET